jgi:hypothetical protein
MLRQTSGIYYIYIYIFYTTMHGVFPLPLAAHTYRLHYQTLLQQCARYMIIAVIKLAAKTACFPVNVDRVGKIRLIHLNCFLHFPDSS